MGDAAGEPSHRVHFLRLAKLLFQLPALGDVFGDQLQHLFRFVADGGGAAAEPDDDDVSVFSLPLHFHAVQAAGAAIILRQAVHFLRADEDLAAHVERQKTSSTDP